MQEDKTVPIDTSGESLEVTLDEDNVKKVDAPVVEEAAVEVETQTEKHKEDETNVCLRQRKHTFGDVANCEGTHLVSCELKAHIWFRLVSCELKAHI